MTKNINSIVFLGVTTLGIGGLSYVYQFIMIKFLQMENFAEFASLIGVINLFTVVTTGLSLFLVKEFSKQKSAKEQNTINHTCMKYGGVMSIVIFSIYILLSPFLANYLQITDLSIVITTGSILLLSFTGLYQNAYFQANHLFKTIGILNFINPVFRIMIGGFLVGLGWSTWGSMIGFILPIYFLFIVRYFYIKKHLTATTIANGEIILSTQKQILSSFLSQKKQIGQYLFSSILIALFMNIDILIVKNMFDGETAGYYAAVSVLAKFLVFLGMSIETVYYPQLVKEKVFPTKQILKIRGYYLLMTLGALGFFWLFGEMILRLFKDGLQEYHYLVFPLLIYCGLLAYTSIIVKTLIAFEKYTVNYILGGVIVALVVSLYMFAENILQLSYIFAVFAGIGLVCSVLSMYTNSTGVKDS